MPTNSASMAREYADHIREANAAFGGEVTRHIKRLAYHSDALLTRFAPFRVGQRATIIESVDCRCELLNIMETLEVGRAGTVIEVDYVADEFIIAWSPDREWRGNEDGEWAATDSQRTYRLPAKSLGAVIRGEPLERAP